MCNHPLHRDLLAASEPLGLSVGSPAAQLWSGEWEAAVDSGTVKGLALDSFTMGIKLLGRLGLPGIRPMSDFTTIP